AGEIEVQLDLHACASGCGERTHVLALAADRGHAVQRPRDALEDRRLARAVRADDAGKPRVEVDAGVDVEPEVGETEMIQSHGVSGSVTTAAVVVNASASLRYLRPSSTMRSRSSSGGMGRSTSF